MSGIGLDNFIFDSGLVHVEGDTLALYNLTTTERSGLVDMLLEDLNFMNRDVVLIVDYKLVDGYLKKLKRQFDISDNLIAGIRDEALASIRDLVDTLFQSGCRTGSYELCRLTDNSLTIKYSESSKWRP